MHAKDKILLLKKELTPAGHRFGEGLTISERAIADVMEQQAAEIRALQAKVSKLMSATEQQE